MEVDPYKLFGLTKDFTLDELKAKFKKLALVTHPDRGGSEALFLLTTKAFKKLIQEYNYRVSGSQHHELKKNFDSSDSSYFNSKIKPDEVSGSRFDANKFNRLYEENRLEQVTDSGYERWMNKNDVPTTSNKKPRGKFDPKQFNKSFETETRKNTENKFIIPYKEPEPLVTTKKIQFMELGVDKIDDYSGENTTKKHLNFMDYKVAHTTDRIVDPSQVSRKDYNDIHALEAEREQVSYKMSPEDFAAYKKKKEQEEEAERRRKHIQSLNDEAAFEQFKKLQRLMLR